jgi:hypothetical protein
LLARKEAVMNKVRALPVALAMLLCDYVIEDKQTNKKSLIGLFSNISAKQFPAAHHRMNVFVVLSDGHGEYKGELRCIKAVDENQISTMKGPVPFPDPNAVLELNFELFGLTFPEPGDYLMQFLCDDEIVVQRKITLTELPQAEEEEVDEEAEE